MVTFTAEKGRRALFFGALGTGLLYFATYISASWFIGLDEAGKWYEVPLCNLGKNHYVSHDPDFHGCAELEDMYMRQSMQQGGMEANHVDHPVSIDIDEALVEEVGRASSAYRVALFISRSWVKNIQTLIGSVAQSGRQFAKIDLPKDFQVVPLQATGDEIRSRNDDNTVRIPIRRRRLLKGGGSTSSWGSRRTGSSSASSLPKRGSWSRRYSRYRRRAFWRRGRRANRDDRYPSKHDIDESADIPLNADEYVDVITRRHKIGDVGAHCETTGCMRKVSDMKRILVSEAISSSSSSIPDGQARRGEIQINIEHLDLRKREHDNVHTTPEIYVTLVTAETALISELAFYILTYAPLLTITLTIGACIIHLIFPYADMPSPLLILCPACVRNLTIELKVWMDKLEAFRLARRGDVNRCSKEWLMSWFSNASWFLDFSTLLPFCAMLSWLCLPEYLCPPMELVTFWMFLLLCFLGTMTSHFLFGFPAGPTYQHTWQPLSRWSREPQRIAKSQLDKFCHTDGDLQSIRALVSMMDGSSHEESSTIEVDSNNISTWNVAIAFNGQHFVQNLNLYNNDLRSISGVSKCLELRLLDVRNNNLKSLAGVKSASLVWLSCADNDIESLGRNFGPFPQIEYLDLHSNNLKNVEELVFTQPGVLFPKLLALDLSNNDLTSLGGLEFIPSLESVNLDNNELGNDQIEVLLSLIDNGLPNLRFVSCRNNNWDDELEKLLDERVEELARQGRPIDIET